MKRASTGFPLAFRLHEVHRWALGIGSVLLLQAFLPVHIITRTPDGGLTSVVVTEWERWRWSTSAEILESLIASHLVLVLAGAFLLVMAPLTKNRFNMGLAIGVAGVAALLLPVAMNALPDRFHPGIVIREWSFSVLPLWPLLCGTLLGMANIFTESTEESGEQGEGILVGGGLAIVAAIGAVIMIRQAVAGTDHTETSLLWAVTAQPLIAFAVGVWICATGFRERVKGKYWSRVARVLLAFLALDFLLLVLRGVMQHWLDDGAPSTPTEPGGGVVPVVDLWHRVVAGVGGGLSQVGQVLGVAVGAWMLSEPAMPGQSRTAE